MKRTFVKMMLLAVLSAIAGQSWAEEATYSITKGEITGGTVKIYGGDDAPNISAGEISSAEKNTTVYLVTETDYTHSCIGITWRVERSGPSSTAESRTRTAGYSAAIKVDYVEGRVYKFTMPEDGSNVLVSAVFPEKKTEEVTYIDPTKPLAEREQKALAYILDGTETYFGSANEYTWFVCKTPATDNDGAGLTYDKYLTTYGFTRFILADGSKMTVGTAASPAGGFALNCFSGTLDIYGQTDGSGTLSTYGNNTGIHCIGQSLTFNGGTVIANGNNGGIYSGAAPITINGGTIKSVVSTGFGIYSSQGNIIINGGKVWATGEHDGIGSSDGIITLGWSHPDDYIYANGYESGAGNAMIAAGQRFVVCDPELSTDNDAFDPGDTKHNANFYFGDAHSTSATPLSGDINPTDAGAEKTIAGKTLMPIAVAETDAQGATTVSPGFLLSVTASGITPVGRTEPDFTLGTTPYYIYKAGGDGVTIPVSVPNYGQEGADFTVSIGGAADSSLPDAAVTVSDGLATAALPWTGANDVELKSARYYCTGVKYLDWNYTTKQLVPATTYVDTVTDPNDPSANSPAPGNTIKVYILTGGTGADLPDGWYMVKNWNTDESNNSGIDAFYTSPVNFTGDTRLILADGARMDIGTSTTPSNGECIHIEPGSLSIYAQSTGPDMGQLNTFAAYNHDCINLYSSTGAHDLTINGGNISCNVNNYSGLKVKCNNAEASVTINGGNISFDGYHGYGINAYSNSDDATVTINGGNITFKDGHVSYGINTFSNTNSSVIINDGTVDLNVIDRGIYVGAGISSGIICSLSIYGGKVKDTSTNGFRVVSSHGEGNILLGWKNVDDYIYSTDYTDMSSVRTVSGQYLMACDAPDVIGKAYGGTLDDTGKNAIKGNYLRPAIYYFSMPDNVNLSITDGGTPVNPLNEGSVGISKHYYLYKEDLTVNASLKNDAMLATIYMNLDNHGDNCLTFTDGHLGNFRQNVNAVGFTMPATNVEITIGNLSVPTTGGKYLAFVDNNANVKTSDDDVVILVFKELRKTGNPPVIEAVFEVVDEVPLGLPVIFAPKDADDWVNDPFSVNEDNSASANTLAATIRQAASPLFMTGTAGQTVADVLRAALTDAVGNPLLDSNNLPLSLDAADYVIFLFDADKFVPVAASASSKLTGRRYLLVVDKVTLLQLLNGGASAARTRDASATDGLTAASAPADNGSARVWTFPLILGNDATGVGATLNDNGEMINDSWYKLDGRKLNQAPKAKGVYIRNGHKEVVR